MPGSFWKFLVLGVDNRDTVTYIRDMEDRTMTSETTTTEILNAIRQAMSDWNNASDEQRANALSYAARLASEAAQR